MSEDESKVPEGSKFLGDDIYVISDSYGNAEFYEKDPLKPKNRGTKFDLGHRILEIMNSADALNPIKMRVLLYPVNRAARFDFNQLRYVDQHPELEVADRCGNSVELTKEYGPNTVFPYIGIVRDENGSEIERRNYSTNGDCSDGIRVHGLIFIRKTR